MREKLIGITEEEIEALREQIISYKQKKIPPKDAVKLRKLGGRVDYTYRVVFREISEIDSQYLEPYQRLGLKGTKKDYLSFLFNPDEAKENFIEDFVKKYKKAHKGDPIKTVKGIRVEGTKAFIKITGQIYIFPLCKVSRYLQAFKKAIEYTPERGLYINLDKFLQLFKRYARGERLEVAKLHKEITGKLNKLFNIPITEDELRRYFKIENGRIEINPLGATEEAYLRLCNRGGSRESCNNILPDMQEIKSNKSNII